jgi:hypothetical protein
MTEARKQFRLAADHEGHKNTGQVRTRYGRFKSTKHDYAKAKPVDLPAKEVKRG